MSGVPRWVGRYLGIPFVLGGRTETACDCWGLVRLVYAERGIALPLYAGISAEDVRAAEQAFTSAISDGPWRPIERADLRDLDVVLMRSRLVSAGKSRVADVHVGLFVAPDRVLHTDHGIESCCPQIGHQSVRSRVVAFYRHEALA